MGMNHLKIVDICCVRRPLLS